MAQTSRGLTELLSLFDNLPSATEQELKDDLPQLGAAVLAIQKADVPVRTGDLFRGLSVQVLAGGFKIRVGLMHVVSAAGKKNFGSLFYGRFVEFGRLGQVVRVQRRRRIKGRLRLQNGRKRASDIIATYSMKVRAAAPRPFVNTPAAENAALNAGENLANFWDRVLTRAGGAN